MKILLFLFYIFVFAQMILLIILAGKIIVDAIEWLGERSGLWAAIDRADDRRIANERKLGWRD